MWKRAVPKRRDDVSPGGRSHLPNSEEHPYTSDQRLKKAAVVFDILNERRKREAGFPQSVRALEAENAQLRNKAIQLTLEIQHLQIARVPCAKTFFNLK
jgi:hypothetical protein